MVMFMFNISLACLMTSKWAFSWFNFSVNLTRLICSDYVWHFRKSSDISKAQLLSSFHKSGRTIQELNTHSFRLLLSDSFSSLQYSNNHQICHWLAGNVRHALHTERYYPLKRETSYVISLFRQLKRREALVNRPLISYFLLNCSSFTTDHGTGLKISISQIW